jgi:predicted dehydrogenase
MIRCAEAGKHLYLDKPLAASSEEAERIAAAARKAGVVSQMFSLVRSPASQRLRQLVESKSLGDVTALHIDMMFAKGFPGAAKLEKPRAETAQPKEFEKLDSKREFTNVGVYPIVLLHWLLRKPVTRVYAFTGNYFFAEHERNNMEDFGAALLEFEGGAVASISAGRPGWRTHPMGGLNRNYVIGQKGVASLDAFRPRLEVWAEEDPWQLPKRHPEDPMGFWSSSTKAAGAATKNVWLTPTVSATDEFAYFLDCVEQGRPSDVSADVAAHATRILMASYQSAASGAFTMVE